MVALWDELEGPPMMNVKGHVSLEECRTPFTLNPKPTTVLVSTDERAFGFGGS